MPDNWKQPAFGLIVVILIALAVIGNWESELTFECHFEKMTGLLVVSQRELRKTDSMILVRTGERTLMLRRSYLVACHNKEPE